MPTLDTQYLLNQLKANLAKVVIGKEQQIEMLLVALLSQGHVLLEDIPGVGKTTMAKAFAISTGCQFMRVQFTPDLLPSDIIGTSIYDPKETSFHFKQGPIFTNILMADEINRASPRTQSSLLEAMAENQVTVEGHSRLLPPPFIVIATQNPIEYHGTYPLPEAQLDRFALSLTIGYPNLEQELKVLYDQEKEHPLKHLAPVSDPEQIRSLQAASRQISVNPDVGKYILRLVHTSRNHPSVQLGVSPRGALMLFQAIKARALLQDRLFAIPEDVKAMAIPVLAHRLVLDTKAKYAGMKKQMVIEEILNQVPVPR